MIAFMSVISRCPQIMQKFAQYGNSSLRRGRLRKGFTHRRISIIFICSASGWSRWIMSVFSTA